MYADIIQHTSSKRYRFPTRVSFLNVFQALPLVAVILMAAAAYGEPASTARVGILNTTRILSLMGFPEGKFDPSVSMDFQFDPGTEPKVGSFERDRSIDTVEEFLTALFYSPSAVNRETRSRLDRELPPGKDGAYLLCAMWLYKRADRPAYSAKYMEAVHYIQKRSRLSGDHIIDFYEKKISAMLSPITAKNLGDSELRILRELLSLYLISPNDEKTTAGITKWILDLRRRSEVKSREAVDIMSGYSSSLANLLGKLLRG